LGVGRERLQAQARVEVQEEQLQLTVCGAFGNVRVNEFSKCR
jgi:hypothetical protein